MTMVRTSGFNLMPPPFRDGLLAWSRGDGTKGSPTWASSADAQIIPADQHFGTCLELTKSAAVTKLRYMGETPVVPGAYLKITARVKAVTGALPSVRIAAWAGSNARQHLDGVVETGPTVALQTHGTVTEVSAIVGVGARWG